MKAVNIYHIITFLLSQNSSQIALSFKILKVNKTTVKLFINEIFFYIRMHSQKAFFHSLTCFLSLLANPSSRPVVAILAISKPLLRQCEFARL